MTSSSQRRRTKLRIGSLSIFGAAAAASRPQTPGEEKSRRSKAEAAAGRRMLGLDHGPYRTGEAPAMPTYEYLIRYAGGLWQIRRGGDLVGAEQHKMDALHVAQALVRAGADRGEHSKILVADIKGSTIEFPMIRPA
jgi:hypothetical protein